MKPLNLHYFNRIKREYGLSFEDFLSIWTRQKGLCGCCLVPLSLSGGGKDMNSLCVDHDHETKKVRSLLCRRCNSVVGWSKESVDYLKSVLLYVNSFK